jgi:endogenous inhibitor of DNA gyrase (YacG/DUF329 family)
MADFTINRKPISISFECPYCEDEVTIPWNEVNAPDYWGDDWGYVECPYCNKEVPLGDYDMD